MFLISATPYDQSSISGYTHVDLLVKHQQLAPTGGQFANDPVMNSMENIDSTDVLEEDTTFLFRSWVYRADGAGSFSSHLIESMQPKAATTNCSNNADSIADNFHEPQLFDVIGKYLNDLKSIPIRRIDNFDLTEGVDRISKNIAECIELAQATLSQQENKKNPEGSSL